MRQFPTAGPRAPRDPTGPTGLNVSTSCGRALCGQRGRCRERTAESASRAYRARGAFTTRATGCRRGPNTIAASSTVASTERRIDNFGRTLVINSYVLVGCFSLLGYSDSSARGRYRSNDHETRHDAVRVSIVSSQVVSPIFRRFFFFFTSLPFAVTERRYGVLLRGTRSRDRFPAATADADGYSMQKRSCILRFACTSKKSRLCNSIIRLAVRRPTSRSFWTLNTTILHCNFLPRYICKQLVQNRKREIENRPDPTPIL